MKHVIIGTAGHVDHGKTELVRALTGHETDRLSEEKKRGISIVLGFAPIDLGPDLEVGVVDVPGHERFVKNMVSGAVGVDVALIAVAADEGVMPQTEEHFEVLRLLGVRSGVIAITKTDLADADMASVVESEVADLLEGTPLEGSVMVRTSVVTGEGLEELRAQLAATASAAAGRAPGGFFRMPVDRIFTRTGIGTIVTGTTWSGRVRTGDELVLEPAGRRVRVREVQSFEHDIDESASGMRTALALHGIKVGEIHTGDQLIEPGVLPVSSIVDAAIEMSRLPGSKLRGRQRVRFHHAAAELLARVVLLEGAELGPGMSGKVQLRLEKPAAVMGGDRFVLRTYSPMRVLAGGRIIDPAAPKAKGSHDSELALLEGLDSGDVRRMIEVLASSRQAAGIETEKLAMYGIDPAEGARAADGMVSSGVLVTDGELYYHAGAAGRFEERLFAVLEDRTGGDELVWGVDREELRGKTGLSGSPLFDWLLAKGEKEGKLFFKGGLVRAGTGELELTGETRELVDRLEAFLSAEGVKFPKRADLVARAGGDSTKMARCMHILQESGKALKIGNEGWISSPAFGKMVAAVADMIESSGSMSVGDFKEAFGLSRKYAVPLLEYLDGNGYTVREGDSRAAGPSLKGDARKGGG